VAAFADVLADFRARLRTRGFDLRETGIEVVFTTPMFDTPILAVPDVHLAQLTAATSSSRASWRAPRSRSHARRHRRLPRHPSAVFLRAQLGDWFDIWRVCGSDPANVDYGDIQNAGVYQNILALDARLGLPHVIGNHDAGFLRSLPDRRAGQPDYFRLGFWIGRNVYAMHGHQTDLAPPQAPRGISSPSTSRRSSPPSPRASRRSNNTSIDWAMAPASHAGCAIRSSAFAKILRSSIALRTMSAARQRSLRILRRTRERRCVSRASSTRLGRCRNRRARGGRGDRGPQPRALRRWTEVTGRPDRRRRRGLLCLRPSHLLLMAGEHLAVFDVV